MKVDFLKEILIQCFCELVDNKYKQYFVSLHLHLISEKYSQTGGFTNFKKLLNLMESVGKTNKMRQAKSVQICIATFLTSEDPWMFNRAVAVLHFWLHDCFQVFEIPETVPESKEPVGKEIITCEPDFISTYNDDNPPNIQKFSDQGLTPPKSQEALSEKAECLKMGNLSEDEDEENFSYSSLGKSLDSDPSVKSSANLSA